LGAPEKRDLQQILFPNQAEADAAEARIKDGASFDDIVRARNLKPEDVELGLSAKDAIIDPTEADAVFALPAGGVSGVLPSQFGPVIVRVKSITPSTVKPFSEVAEDIKRRISAGRAVDKIQALHDKVEDLRVSGKPLAEAAKSEGLTTLSVPAVDAQGKDPSGKEVALPDAAELLRSAFASDVGLDEAPISTKDSGFVWFAVNKVEPSHERSFEEARPQVEAQWRAEQVDKQLAAKAADLVKQLRDGASAAVVAKSVGASVRAVADIRRSNKDLPEPVVAAIFREPADGVGSAATPDGRTVFKITSDKTPPIEAIDPQVKQMASQLDGASRESLIDQYVAALRRSLGVTVNPTVMQSAEGG
jgi:peptidyl-prolyl cis-trans isomerase D